MDKMLKILCIYGFLGACTASSSTIVHTAAPVTATDDRAAMVDTSTVLSPRIANLVAASDTVAIASVRTIDNRRPLKDGNRTTITLSIERLVKGRENSMVSLRFSEGYNQNGSLAEVAGPIRVLQSRNPTIRVGDRLVIFTSEQSYAEGSSARGGKPIAGNTQAIAIFTVDGSTATAISDRSLFFDISKLDRINNS